MSKISWETQDWKRPDWELAIITGVSTKAVAYQRKKRGKAKVPTLKTKSFGPIK